MEPWLSPLLDADGMRAVDRWAIEDRGVPSLELMENAGRAVAEAAAKAASGRRVAIVCGKGNNGGDGLVTARLLAGMGYEADALLLWPAEELTADARANLERYPGARHVEGGALAEALGEASVVVDAIFGTGFSGEPRDPAGAAVEAINSTEGTVVATDIASGVDASSGEAQGVAVAADVTITFHAAKVGHWIAPGKTHTGRLEVAPIGIPDRATADTEAAAGLIDPQVLSLLPGRRAGSTKFSSGQVAIVGGSRGLTGAVCLAARAAIRSGAGYATVAVPAELEQIFEVKLTEVMSVGCASREGRLRRAASEQIMEATARAAAVILGPGIGRDDGTRDLVRDLAKRIEAPLLIDADGLNAHAGRIGPLAKRQHATVLTPHEGELGRLLETDSERVRARRLGSAREAAQASGSIVVLKGDDTIITDGERFAISRGGSPALATAGTGDVLSGVCGAMMARGADPFAAACAAVLAHTRAGRVAADRVGAPESVIAGDVVGALPAGLAP
ncbi:MAG TPA: NAD(P)H-hydrate dehydratase [Solirubrobacterales bacterium]|jgi:NAD(P)H-hydrate epimerase|nr:NAD(P)H-hydrate dehydratase [Solirubrobacterales bacterium]